MQVEQQQREKDSEIYQYIFNRQQLNLSTIQVEYTFHFGLAYITLNVIFKFILIMHFQIQTFLDTAVGIWISTQFIVIMIIIDFWFTKNVCGRALVGLRWFYDHDPYGTLRFMYEARVNEDYVNWVFKRLFWYIQISYALLGYIDINTIFGIQYSIYDVSIVLIIVSVAKIITSLANLFLFYKANKDYKSKVEKLKSAHGMQFIHKLGPASMVVYF